MYSFQKMVEKNGFIVREDLTVSGANLTET